MCVLFYLLYLRAPFYLLCLKYITESAYVSQGSSVLEVLYPLLLVLLFYNDTLPVLKEVWRLSEFILALGKMLLLLH